MNRKTTGKAGPGRSAFHRSAEFRAIANAALIRYNAQRPFLPKCGAKRKRDGEPCQQLALANGRCRFHGGRTPKGAGWHKPVWPDKAAPGAEQKLRDKLRALERAARKRAARLATMTPEEQAQHAKWHRERPVGSPVRREAARLERQRNAAARACLDQPRTSACDADPEYQEIIARIAELKALLARHDTGAAAPAHDEAHDQGVFG